MNPVTAILIGAGARGQIYARYAQEHPEELRIIAVAEPKADRRALMCRAYGIPADRAFSNWEDLMARPQMADAALICTLDDMHTEPTLAALKQGYHVLLEKPMSNSETECRAIAAAAEEAQRVLSVCHVLRYTWGKLRLCRKLRMWATGTMPTALCGATGAAVNKPAR